MKVAVALSLILKGDLVGEEDTDESSAAILRSLETLARLNLGKKKEKRLSSRRPKIAA